MLCVPGDLGGADNPSGLSPTKLTLQIVFAMSNDWEGTPLQAPTKWLSPRTYIAIKPRVGAHWGLCPDRDKNKIGRKPNPVKSPIPSEFSCVVCCSKHCPFFSLSVGGGGVQLLWPLWGGTVAQHRIFHGLNLSIVQLQRWWGIRMQPSPLRSLRAWVD